MAGRMVRLIEESGVSIPLFAFDPNQSDLECWFGSTEAAIMRVLFDAYPRTLYLSELCDRLARDEHLTRTATTVQNIAIVLARKGVVALHPVTVKPISAPGTRYAYAARWSRAAFVAAQRAGLLAALADVV